MSRQPDRQMRVFPDLESLSWAAAQETADLLRTVAAEQDRLGWFLSGGNTPRTLHRLVAEDYAEDIPWSKIHLFWGDERCVPRDHLDSNYAQAFETLISRVPIPPENVHPIPVEIEPLEQAAQEYEQQLRRFFQPPEGREDPLSPDLILLGVGRDGHTASLFPGNPVLDEDQRWVRAVPCPPQEAPHPRITLTLPFINRARHVFFLACGEEKRSVVRSIADKHPRAGHLYPAARVKPPGSVLWFVDRAASR
jgi:6-phosphogluconolactonase